MHDPLTACTAYDKTIITFREVQLNRYQGGWGSVLCEGTNTFISVKVDIPKFYSIYLNISIEDINNNLPDNYLQSVMDNNDNDE